MAKGLLTGKYDKDHKPEDPLRTDHVLFRDMNLASVAELLRIMKEVGEAHDRTIPQVALNWHLFHEGVIPIPGAKRPAHVESNVGAVGWDLSEKEFAQIDASSAAIEIDQF
ncbi:MAG: aldo/keto reductase [Thermoplasmata archaeon]